MADDKSKGPPEKKKDRQAEKKVMGPVRTSPDTEAMKPGPPAYEHG